MSDKPMMSMHVDPDMVKGILEREIQAAIVAQLNNAPNLIAGVVNMAMKQKVDESGRVNSYSHYNTHTLIEALSANCIRAAAEQGVREWVEVNKPEIMKAVKAHMNTHKSKVIKQFVDAVDKSICPEFRIDMKLAPVVRD